MNHGFIALGETPAGGRERQQWRRRAVVVAAYRDRYQITDLDPLGAQPEGAAQKVDCARVDAALRTLTRPTVHDERRRPRPGEAAPQPVIAGYKKWGPAPSEEMVRDPTNLPTGLQRSLRRTSSAWIRAPSSLQFHKSLLRTSGIFKG